MTRRHLLFKLFRPFAETIITVPDAPAADREIGQTLSGVVGRGQHRTRPTADVPAITHGGEQDADADEERQADGSA